MSIFSLDKTFRQLFPLSQLLSWTKAKKLLNFFLYASKVKFSRELERNEERLNELTLLIVNSGVVPISVCPAGQPA